MKTRFLIITIILFIFTTGCSSICREFKGVAKNPSSPSYQQNESSQRTLADYSIGYPMEESGYPLGAGGSAIPNGKAYDLTFYEDYGVNPFIAAEDENFSTFGMDVDTASYTIARRYVQDGNIPEKDSIRTEEFINYFDQQYPDSNDVFSINIEGAKSEFGKPNYHLLKIGLKASEISLEQRKPANMVFVVDVSSSMQREDRLEQVKKSMRSLAECLKDGDEIGLVVYGSNGRIISDLTSDRRKIFSAIDQLVPSGSTNAEEGLNLAYGLLNKHFDSKKINRIILCSDGVANVGTTDAKKFLENIKQSAEKGITLTCLGFGMGNYNDVFMEKLANHGDGNYYYIDSPMESDRIFGNGATSLLQVLASDAKIQVEFNPKTVDRYRLLGYENRRLNKEDFEDDSVDAGEVGVGQTVTALYEIRIKDDAIGSSDLNVANVRIRYKNLDTHEIETNERSVSVSDMARDFDNATWRFKFCAAVAEFAEILKESYWAKDSSIDNVLAVADKAFMDSDLAMLSRMTPEMEFLQMVHKVQDLKKGIKENPEKQIPIDDRSDVSSSENVTEDDVRRGM